MINIPLYNEIDNIFYNKISYAKKNSKKKEFYLNHNIEITTCKKKHPYPKEFTACPYCLISNNTSFYDMIPFLLGSEFKMNKTDEEIKKELEEIKEYNEIQSRRMKNEEQRNAVQYKLIRLKESKWKPENKHLFDERTRLLNEEIAIIKEQWTKYPNNYQNAHKLFDQLIEKIYKEIGELNHESVQLSSEKNKLHELYYKNMQNAHLEYKDSERDEWANKLRLLENMNESPQITTEKINIEAKINERLALMKQLQKDMSNFDGVFAQFNVPEKERIKENPSYIKKFSL